MPLGTSAPPHHFRKSPDCLPLIKSFQGMSLRVGSKATSGYVSSVLEDAAHKLEGRLGF